MEDLLYFLSLDDWFTLFLFLAGFVGCSLFVVKQFELPILTGTFTQSFKTIADNINATLIETYPVQGNRKRFFLFLSRLKQGGPTSEDARTSM